MALTRNWVETLALETTSGGAWRHYYRWQKTIRWCQPAAYAALIAILPLLGWGLVGASGGLGPAGWAGLVGAWGFEVVIGGALCRAAGCRLAPGAWAMLGVWPWLRVVAWIAVWLPVAVRWRGPRADWRGPTA